MASWTQANQNYSSRVGIVLRKSFSPLKSYISLPGQIDVLWYFGTKWQEASEPFWAGAAKKVYSQNSLYRNVFLPFPNGHSLNSQRLMLKPRGISSN